MFALISKKETISRKPFKCTDCGKEYPQGSYIKRYVFKEGEKYITGKICEECKDYYKRKDLDYEKIVE